MFNDSTLSEPTIAIVETYQRSYGKLTHGGQARLIRLLNCVQRMAPADVELALTEIAAMDPTV